jgi:hypothetical protein
MKAIKVSAIRERGLRPGARAPVNAILCSLGRVLKVTLSFLEATPAPIR